MDDIHNEIWRLKEEVLLGTLSPIETSRQLLKIYSDMQAELNHDKLGGLDDWDDTGDGTKFLNG